jgi:hypothetical protein
MTPSCARRHRDADATACSRLIESGKQIGRSLAIAYAYRAIHYSTKGPLDRVIADTISPS